MRTLALVVLSITGCAEHGSSPDAGPSDARKLYSDAQVTRCVSPNGSANVSAAPASFVNVYAGSVSGGFVAPEKVAGTPFTLRLLFVNAPEADEMLLFPCTENLSGCPIDGLFVFSKNQLSKSTAIGSHPVGITRTRPPMTTLDGAVEVTEFVDPFEDQPGHITGTISGVSPALGVNGSFSTPFCPPMMMFLI